MNRETVGHSEKSASARKQVHKFNKESFATAEALLPTGSWQRVAVGVAAAAGGGLIAAAMVGVGPAAIAGAAGYLAYRGLSGKKKSGEFRSELHKH